MGQPSGQGLDFINGFTFLQRFYTVYGDNSCDPSKQRVGKKRIGFATVRRLSAQVLPNRREYTTDCIHRCRDELGEAHTLILFCDSHLCHPAAHDTFLHPGPECWRVVVAD